MSGLEKMMAAYAMADTDRCYWLDRAARAERQLEEAREALRRIAESVAYDIPDRGVRETPYEWARNLARAVLAAAGDAHDNGESTVDDPECGTDIGPFPAAGGSPTEVGT